MAATQSQACDFQPKFSSSFVNKKKKDRNRKLTWTSAELYQCALGKGARFSLPRKEAHFIVSAEY